ncbi:MAG: HNH endonuclease signature motif containing protein [Eubacteriales bacterium]|nr:HNH endonuclease signature motif containing protein [Eubacteriales bacterium]
MGQIHTWTDEEKEFLRRCVKNHTWKEATEIFNLKFGCSLTKEAIKAAGDRYGIRTGRTGCFEKGHVPANKGKHNPTVGRMAETQFKKGNIPANHKPVGTVSIRNHHKRGQRYVYEKIAEPNVWRMKHILEWERHNGPVPKGKVIVFADGNSLNTDIENLVMVDRSQLAVMNRWNIKGANKELMETAVNTAALKISISKAKKSGKERRKRRNDTGDRT